MKINRINILHMHSDDIDNHESKLELTDITIHGILHWDCLFRKVFL